MKTIVFTLIFVGLVSVLRLNGQQLQKIWETKGGLATPESALYDDQKDVIYVSNINGNPADKDGNGFISILNSDGTVKTLEWVK